MIRLTKNEEEKILRITSEWKVYHLEYYLNGFAVTLLKLKHSKIDLVDRIKMALKRYTYTRNST